MEEGERHEGVFVYQSRSGGGVCTFGGRLQFVPGQSPQGRPALLCLRPPAPAHAQALLARERAAERVSLAARVRVPESWGGLLARALRNPDRLYSWLSYRARHEQAELHHTARASPRTQSYLCESWQATVSEACHPPSAIAVAGSLREPTGEPFWVRVEPIPLLEDGQFLY